MCIKIIHKNSSEKGQNCIVHVSSAKPIKTWEWKFSFRNSEQILDRSVLRVKSHLTSCTASSSQANMETDHKILILVRFLWIRMCCSQNNCPSSVHLEHEEISCPRFSSESGNWSFARINTFLQVCIFRLTLLEPSEVKPLPVWCPLRQPFICSRYGNSWVASPRSPWWVSSTVSHTLLQDSVSGH